jgi:hypothetical protein
MQLMAFYNWYAVMGIAVDATPTAAQIAARKELAQRWHVSDGEWSTIFVF